MIIEVSIDIDKPIDEVFLFTNNEVPKWSNTVVKEEVVEETPEKVGSKYKIHTKSEGREVILDGEVTKWDVPNASAINMTSSVFDIFAEYFFEDLGEGRTRVSQRSTITPKGFVKVMMWIGKLFGAHKKSCEAGELELKSLKKIMEEG